MVGDLGSMAGKIKVWASVLALIPLMPGFARAQSLVRIRKSVSPAAVLITDAVTAPPEMPMEIVVRLNLRNTAEMEQLKQDQQDRSSPNYHQWLTAEQFNERFGPTQEDADTVAQWLRGAGFEIAEIDLGRRLITARAKAAVVAGTLKVKIVSDGTLFANTTEPSVPAAIARLIANIEGLHNTFAVKPTLGDHFVLGPALRERGATGAAADFATPKGGTGFSPSDLRKYYNETPILSSGDTGTGTSDCIALPEISNVHNGTLATFTKDFNNTDFSLPPIALTKVIADKKNPGFQGDAEVEADLDIEYSHSVAPSTPIELYLGAGQNSLLDAIGKAVTSNRCGVISISYTFCGMPDSFFSVTLDQIFSEAAMQGQTVFAATGDYGAAGVQAVKVRKKIECGIGTSLNVSEMAADPNVTGVGGTQFDAQYEFFGANDISTVLDGIESAWNNGGGATGGGMSMVFDHSRATWQSGSKVPAASMRMVPDVAFGASGTLPGFYIVGFYRGANRLFSVSGTSVGSPSWAGFSRLIAEASGEGNRIGLMNPRLYELGNMGSESGLIDVTTGDNSFNGVIGYSAGPGYDMTTGWGSPDMGTLLDSYLGK